MIAASWRAPSLYLVRKSSVGHHPSPLSSVYKVRSKFPRLFLLRTNRVLHSKMHWAGASNNSSEQLFFISLLDHHQHWYELICDSLTPEQKQLCEQQSSQQRSQSKRLKKSNQVRNECRWFSLTFAEVVQQIFAPKIPILVDWVLLWHS